MVEVTSMEVVRMPRDSNPKSFLKTFVNLFFLKIRTLRLRFDTASFENFDDNKLHIFLDKCQKDLIAIDNLLDKAYF